MQTLTKAMTSILCKGLEGVSPQELLVCLPTLCRRSWGQILCGSAVNRLLHSHPHEKCGSGLVESAARA